MSNREPMVEMRFVPQAWSGDYAIPVDAEGEADWSAPLGEVLALCDGVLPDDDQYASDDLRNLPEAPAWAQDWSGPFYVTITNRDELEAYMMREQVEPSMS